MDGGRTLLDSEAPPRSALCPALADLSVPLLWGLVHSQWHWATPHFKTSNYHSRFHKFLEHAWISRTDRKLLTTVYYVVSLFWCLTLIVLVSIHACSDHVVKSSGNQKMVPDKLILLLLALQGRWEIKLMSVPAVQSIISHLQIWKIREV